MWTTGACRILSFEDQTHQHSHNQVILGLSGRLCIELPNKHIHHITDQHACVLPSHCPHTLINTHDHSALMVEIKAYDSALHHFDARAFKQLFDKPEVVTLDSHFKSLLNCLAHELSQRPQDTTLQQHISGVLLHSLSYRITPSTHTPPPHSERIDLAVLDQFINEKITEKLGVDVLAKVCHMSVSQFHLRFRQLVGMTPHQYIMQQRVQQAVWLLQNSPMSISAVAAETGFANQSALNHAIKARLKTSPGQLRQTSKKFSV